MMGEGTKENLQRNGTTISQELNIWLALLIAKGIGMIYKNGRIKKG